MYCSAGKALKPPARLRSGSPPSAALSITSIPTHLSAIICFKNVVVDNVTSEREKVSIFKMICVLWCRLHTMTTETSCPI